MSQSLVVDRSLWEDDLVFPTREDIHYLRTVLRLHAGDTLVLADGSGQRFQAEIVELGRSRCTLRIGEAVTESSESSLRIMLWQALPRAKTMDVIVQKATELGVASIQPVITERSFRPDSTSIAKKWVTRWQKIAREASRQCGRGLVPVIEPPLDIRVLLVQGLQAMTGFLFWEDERQRPLKQVLASLENLESCVLFVGPEGGFTRDEAQKATHAGFSCVTLGPRIMRTETAAIAGLSILQFSHGDVG